MDKHSISPNKQLGQHFLKDKNIAQKIVNSLKDVDGEFVLEIGGGTGVLTQYLIKSYDRFSVIDIDDRSIHFLQQKYPQHAHLFVEGDFLQQNLSEISINKGTPIHIIGNLPYNISSQIFFQILRHTTIVPQVVCMVQKEVAERIASPHGCKSYGILSVLLQAFYDISYLFTVCPQVFIPPPKVDSAVLRLVHRTDPLPKATMSLFTQVVKGAFAHRRKMLRNTLSNYFSEVPSSEELDSYKTRRPEELSVEDFKRLTDLFQGK